jgi:hypothetical protein
MERLPAAAPDARMARPNLAPALPAAEPPPRTAAVVALSAAPGALPHRLAELSAQHGPYGLPLARGAFRAVVGSGDPRAAWRYGRTLPFPARILPAEAPSPRDAALQMIAAEAPGAVLVLPAPGAPIPPDLVHSLLAGLRPDADACLRQDGAACHLALRPGLALLLPAGDEAAALARGGYRVARAVAAPETPPPPRRPGWLQRWFLARLEPA